MNNQNFHVSNVRFVQAPKSLQRAGLLGWISCEVNGTLKLEGLTLRCTLDGRRILGFPSRIDGQGKKRFFIKPLNSATRMDIELQILEALGIQEGAV